MSDSLRWSSVRPGTMQRRLAQPLRKDDTHKSRSVLYIDWYYPLLSSIPLFLSAQRFGEGLLRGCTFDVFRVSCPGVMHHCDVMCHVWQGYSLWRWDVTFHVLDVSHETPDVTPCRTPPPMPAFRTCLVRNAWCHTMSHRTAAGRSAIIRVECMRQPTMFCASCLHCQV